MSSTPVFDGIVGLVFCVALMLGIIEAFMQVVEYWRRHGG